VKSLRESKVQLRDAYARFTGRELYLLGLHIAAYSNASAQGGHELERTRKLLLHEHELEELKQRVDQEHLTVVPLSLYFKGGRAKVELGLGRGRKHYDKRQAIAQRDADRDAQRAMAAARRRSD
jgi:SsrA-binding protein